LTVLYISIASAATIYVAPVALGSGVAEAMGVLIGVWYPDYIDWKALVVKFFGVALAVSAGICGGKEGPLVHMGAIVGVLVPYIPIKIFKYFRNDLEKRKFMAIGTAAGVSSAFGAPIGGALFAYEISKPNTFWSFSLTWKVFFAASMSCFFVETWEDLYKGKDMR
jgi:chloride channel 7